MNPWLSIHSPLMGLGMTSLVLGVIALLLFFLPILGIPLAAFGMFFGIVGFFVGFFPPGTSLRWSVAGTAVCALALAINVAIAYAPGGYLSDRKAPKPWEEPPSRPYVPPPAPAE
jgi:hypothetical protein